ncbi:hypothetical protein [Streptomyces kebangsaanensis]|uniref:hypothetical protein n=1 Tax=Streptomyces kebangsaanensis TaxID=864058 RepID=UPI00093ECE84|nr:hypothetical protein [Streptomyces kebangsaanensis]
MRLWPRRRTTTAQARADPIRTAVLEHDLLGIKPEPGTAAALAIALRNTGTCIEHQPVDATTYEDRRRTGLCARCGQSMLQTDDGCWRVAEA